MQGSISLITPKTIFCKALQWAVIGGLIYGGANAFARHERAKIDAETKKITENYTQKVTQDIAQFIKEKDHVKAERRFSKISGYLSAEEKNKILAQMREISPNFKLRAAEDRLRQAENTAGIISRAKLFKEAYLLFKEAGVDRKDVREQYISIASQYISSLRGKPYSQITNSIELISNDTFIANKELNDLVHRALPYREFVDKIMADVDADNATAQGLEVFVTKTEPSIALIERFYPEMKQPYSHLLLESYADVLKSNLKEHKSNLTHVQSMVRIKKMRELEKKYNYVPHLFNSQKAADWLLFGESK